MLVTQAESSIMRCNINSTFGRRSMLTNEPHTHCENTHNVCNIKTHHCNWRHAWYNTHTHTQPLYSYF